MKVKFGLLLKFILLFIGFIAMILFAVWSFLTQSYQKLWNRHHLDYAVSIARIVEDKIEDEDLQAFVKDGKNEDYDRMLEQMQEIQKRSGVYYLYIVLVENDEKGTYIFDLKLENEEFEVGHDLGDDNPLKENYPGLEEVLNTKKPSASLDDVPLEAGLKSAYLPMLNEDGEVFAFVGVDFDARNMAREVRKEMDESGYFLLAVMAGCFLILILIVQISILGPVYRLKDGAQLISEGKFDFELKVRGRDEISEITAIFNRMAQSIAGHMREMQILNDAYYKYVPAKFLTLLGKNDITAIELGNEASSMLTIFSFQLADFNRDLRKKSTREMIDAINQVLHISVPVVTDQEGMIETIQDAGFTALFDNRCEEALLSAVTICQKLNQMERQKKLGKNQAGMGIAYGPVTLGIVGHAKRMAAITVSQFRDIACYLQSIAYQYQSHILITQTTVENIPGFFDTYHTRTLGFLYNTYTGGSERIYDVYDGDSKEEIECKDATKEMFEKGVELFCVRDFVGARLQFISVLKRFRKDRAAKEYLYLCDKNSMSEHVDSVDIYFTKME